MLIVDRTLAEFALSLAPAALSAAGGRLASAERATLAAPHVEKAQLAVLGCYRAAGITPDPATHDRPAPLLRDLASTLDADPDPASRTLAARMAP
jgi:hypothetical protein